MERRTVIGILKAADVQVIDGAILQCCPREGRVIFIW